MPEKRFAQVDWVEGDSRRIYKQKHSFDDEKVIISTEAEYEEVLKLRELYRATRKPNFGSNEEIHKAICALENSPCGDYNPKIGGEL